MGPRAPPRAQGTGPRSPSAEMPSSACTVGLGVGSSSWTRDERRTRTRANRRRGTPGEGTRAPRTRPGVPAGGGRPGARGGGGCCRRRPFPRPRPPPRESRWNPRQPISAPRRGLISMSCACAHLPPGGGVWPRWDAAEPQVRPACAWRPASGSICRR